MDKHISWNFTYIDIKDWGKEHEIVPKVDVSFKKTTRDMKLYTMIMTKEEKSDFIKDAIENYLEYLNQRYKNKSTQNE